MTKRPQIPRIGTGVRNLDEMLHGGLPEGSVTVVSGPPGSGKTILAQEICFHNATAGRCVLYFSTLSEPTAKTLRYLSVFTFFDPALLERTIHFVDLGAILRTQGLEQASALIMEHLRRVRPALVVIDSFKVFDDLARSQEELRKFGYEIAVNLMAWEATALLLGEYGPQHYQTNPLFSIIDGLIAVTHRCLHGEEQRLIQAIKMRGTKHSGEPYPFVISSAGIEIYAPRLTIHREDGGALGPGQAPRCRTGISKLDDLLGEGIPYGASVLLAGAAGTGKTVFMLEFVYRGAQAGEKGILFSFEETPERLRAAARGLGWDLDREIEAGRIEIVFIPQPTIHVEGHLLMMRERIAALSARRVAVDSMSVFLHRVKDPEVARENVFQLASIVHNSRAVGLLATDVPYGHPLISRFAVEETVADGVILLSSVEEGLERHRYLEVYKLRNTAHLRGRHSMTIGADGISIFPRYTAAVPLTAPPPPPDASRRLSLGVPGLDELLGGGVLLLSMTLISGSAGIGKSTMGVQFILEGARQGEHGLYVTLEEGPAQILDGATALGLPLRPAVEQGLVDIVYLSREHVRAAQFLSILADRIQATQARRLVFDSASHVVNDGLPPEDLRLLLYSLVVRFKTLGVTSLFTLESKSLFSDDTIADHGLSPCADNLIVLRYGRARGRIQPSLTIVKTRGSPHDFDTHAYDIGQGGVRIQKKAQG